MKWVILAVAVLAGLVGLMAVVGATLPAAHVATRSARLPGAREAVFDLLADPAGYPRWRADVKRVELLPDVDGKRSFREHGSNGTITFVIDEARRPERLVTRIADDRLPFGGTWTYELAPDGGTGTQLTITEHGVVKNVVFRFISRFVLGHAATIEKLLASLQTHVGAAP